MVSMIIAWLPEVKAPTASPITFFCPLKQICNISGISGATQEKKAGERSEHVVYIYIYMEICKSMFIYVKSM